MFDKAERNGNRSFSGIDNNSADFINHTMNIKGQMTLMLFFLSTLGLKAQEMILGSKDGRKMSGNIVQVYDDSVEFKRDDGKEFTISFDKLDEETVTKLKQIAIDEKNAAIAAQKKKMEEEAAELAKIPKFPERPNKIEDLPQKVVFEVKDGKEAFVRFEEQVKAFFVAPSVVDEIKEGENALSISSAAGGGEFMIILSHDLCPEMIGARMIIRKKGDESLPEPETVSIPSKISKPTATGAVSAGYFAKRVPGDVTEIILYDFSIEQPSN